MGNDFNPLNPIDPVGVNPYDPVNILTRNDDSTKMRDSLGNVSNVVDTSKLFNPYDKYIPQAMNSNGPITDPSAILAAYRNNLPEFMKASGAITPPPAPGKSLSERQQSK